MLECPEAIVNKNKAPINMLSQLKNEKVELETIKPGDASIAAPFTIKSNSLKSIIEIIQQGRSSLVTTIQMYKILALNSVTGAFFTMIVDILGIKFSDYQMISLGIISSIGFSAITQPRTLSTISKEKPFCTIFNLYVFVSLFFQSIIQIFPMYVIYKAVPYTIMTTKSFEASKMNTLFFVISAGQTISTFVCNYIGRPFREDIHENRILILSILAMVGFIFNVLFKIHTDLNDLIQVVDISEHSSLIVGLMFGMIILGYFTEKICFNLFMIK